MLTPQLGAQTVLTTNFLLSKQRWQEGNKNDDETFNDMVSTLELFSCYVWVCDYFSPLILASSFFGVMQDTTLTQTCCWHS